MKYYIIFSLLFCSSIVFGQETDNQRMTKEQAKVVLNETLSDSTQHNVIGNEPILTDQGKAVKFLEMVLFDIYGKKKIEKQKPYDVYNIDGYWLIKGTLPKGKRGGTFLVIINSRSYEIIRLTHSK